MLWDVPKLVPPLADLVFRSPHQTSRTRLATHSVDAPCVGPTTKTPAYLVLRNSTATDLAVARLPRQWPGARSALACASVPTDDGAAISRADPEAPWKAARSTESVFPPAASELNPRLADRVSASVARPPVCLLDDRPGIRFPTLPSGSETFASIQWLRSLLALADAMVSEPDGRVGNRMPGR